MLCRLLESAADTEWGRRYDFASIAKADDAVDAFRRSVPLHTYDDLHDDTQRVRGGARDVMWRGKISHFAVSSGTVSDGKLIPVSDEMLRCDRRFSLAVGLHYIAASRNPHILLGKHLALPGAVETDERGSLVGEISGILAAHTPFWLKTMYQAAPKSIWNMANWEQKLEALVEETLERDIRVLVMAPTWSLVLFRRLIAKYNERHDRSVATVGEIWPNLKLFISGGVALSSYHSIIEEMTGLEKLDFLETYGASEGFFSFQTDLKDPAMLLHLDNGVYFEFVRLDDISSDEPERVTIDEVEPGVRYAPYISTCSGLWAYRLGDVVRFTRTNPHMILVAGRTSEMMDAYGEAVFGDEVRAALEEACRALDAPVREYHVAPLAVGANDLPRHQWLVEFERPPADTSAFADAVDAHLQSVNRHYRIRREARAFGGPEIVPLPEGSFYQWMRAERTFVSAQTKVPRVSEERAIADGVIARVRNLSIHGNTHLPEA